jgi:hypothetical protein
MRGARALTTDEDTLLLQSYTGRYSNRDKLFYLPCRWTGARVSQALYLKVWDVYDGRRPLDLVYFPRQSRNGKRGGQTMRLKPVVQEAITAWNGIRSVTCPNPPWCTGKASSSGSAKSWSIRRL